MVGVNVTSKYKVRRTKFDFLHVLFERGVSILEKI